MGAGHTHGDHRHGHGAASNSRRLALVLGLVVLYMGAEVAGGILTNSLTLLADAGHMLSDAASLALSLFAIWIASRPATVRHTYGYYRTEILAALVNGAALVAIAVYIFVEAYQRLGDPPVVQAPLMIWIATGGLVVNLVGLWILSGGRNESLNVRGAWLHVLTDALGSVGAIAAGAMIVGFGWYWVDPAASIAIALLVLFSSWKLLRETVAVLMEGAPGHIDVDEVHAAIRSTPGVLSAHDLHVWTITSGMVALSAHVTATEPLAPARLLRDLRDLLHQRFGIDHVTIQIEPEEYDKCRGCTPVEGTATASQRGAARGETGG